MVRNPVARTFISAFLLLIAAWIAVPKVYVHVLMHHHHQQVGAGDHTSVQSGDSHGCDFGKYDKPSYFNLFKFVSSFILHPSGHADKSTEYFLQLSRSLISANLLRGPPASAF